MCTELPPGPVDEVLAPSEEERHALMLALKETVAIEFLIAHGQRSRDHARATEGTTS